MSYTVHELAELAGVSVRMLHYYDEIGLLTPEREHNGYRVYEEKQLLLLQQILFFRELDFSLEDIKRIITSSDFTVLAALRDHRKLIRLKQQRLQKLLNTIDNTIKRMNKKTINNKQLAMNKRDGAELYDAFKDEDVKHYQEEVKQRWGSTEAYKQSMAKVSKMTKAQMDELKQKQEALTRKLADAMDKDIASKEVQALVAEHYKGICFFYDCPLPMYKNLAQMYIDDPRFTAYYEKYRLGLAKFLRDAIVYFCEVNK